MSRVRHRPTTCADHRRRGEPWYDPCAACGAAPTYKGVDVDDLVPDLVAPSGAQGEAAVIAVSDADGEAMFKMRAGRRETFWLDVNGGFTTRGPTRTPPRPRSRR